MQESQRIFSLEEKESMRRHQPNSQKWRFDLTKSSVENCLFWGSIYVAIYLAAFVILVGITWQWNIINLFIGWIFIFNEPTFRHVTMYYIGLPAILAGGLIFPWIRNTGPTLQSAFGFRYIPHFLAGVAVIAIVIITVCIIIDVLKMIIRKSAIKDQNKSIREKSQLLYDGNDFI